VEAAEAVVALEEAQEAVDEGEEEDLVSFNRLYSQELFRRMSSTIRRIRSNIRKATEAIEVGEVAVEYLVEEVLQEAGAEQSREAQGAVRKWLLFVFDN
jgi:hypothetical protein